MNDGFAGWMQTLEARHFADLRFSEVSRALRALSSTYVERRRGIARGDVLAGAGKRAAFAMFYAPLHFLIVREIIRALSDQAAPPTIVDLGCGTGAAGAAWAVTCGPAAAVLGVDKHPWALGEAEHTYRQFELAGRTRAANIETFKLPPGRLGIVAAFSINEITDRARDALLPRLIDRSLGGDRILVVEPLAGFVAPWWKEWRAAFESKAGRSDEWRFRLELPEVVARLDRAAGLNHRELTGRSLWLGSAESP